MSTEAGALQLAERLMVGVEPRTLVEEHALATTRAGLSEAHGDLEVVATA